MSDILIRGIEMPTSCDMCWALDDYGDYPRCRITEEQRGYNFPIREKRMDNCPLVPVPPHGRLGDLDKLEQMFVDIDNAPYSGFDGEEPFYSAEDAAQIIRLAPTIIEAEEDE